MRKICFIAMALSVTLFAGCQDENDILNVQNEPNVVLKASIENGSAGARTALKEEGNTLKVVWSKNDLLSFFSPSKDNVKYELTSGDGTTDGNFEFVTISGGTEDSSPSSSATASTYVAYYPYADNVTLVSNNEGKYTISAVFPSNQTYSESGSFGNGASPMMAVAASTMDANLQFRNVGSLVRLPLKGTAEITGLELKSASGLKLAGDYTVTASNTEVPSVTMGDAAVSSITLNCPQEGVQLNETTETIFVFALVPTNFPANDLVITINDAEGNSMMYVYEEALNLGRKQSKELSAVTYSGEATTEVKTEAILKTALAKGGDVKLASSITLNEPLSVDKDANIDLGGNSLNLGNHIIELKNGADLTLGNNNPLVPVGRTAAGTTTVGITGSSDIIKASANSTITIGEGVNLTTSGANSCCIWIPAGAENVTVNTAGNLKATTAGAAVISHNGKLTSGTINITGGSVIHEQDVAVYIAGVADLKISGNAEIKGTTGVEIRAGKLEVDGATISTESDFAEVANGNGTTITGAAIAVSQHTTEKAIEVTIKNGTFDGEYALYEKDLQADPTTVTMSVTGGTFNGSIYSENCTSFITAGTFSDPSACQYLGKDANVTVNMTSDYEGPGFKTQSGQTVKLTLGENVTYDVTKPLVGSTGTQSQAFQFLSGSTVTIEGGKLTSSQARMFMNNYANLTLKNVTLEPQLSSETKNSYYVLSNNNGSVTIENGTVIKAPTATTEVPNVYAMDVCKYQSYSGVTAAVKAGATINGDIEYTGGGDAWKLNIEGGTLNGKIVVADTNKENAKAGISITGGTFSDASAFNYLANNANVSLGADIEIATPITINTTGSIDFNLGAYGLTNKTASDYDGGDDTECYVFEVKAGTLNISGTGSVNAVGGSDYDMAVFANGTGEVNISGGKFTNKGKDNDGSDLIYVRDNAKVTISGGEFEAGNVSKDVGDGTVYVALNLRGQDDTKASITVTGGTFHKFNPADPGTESETWNANHSNGFVATGYSSSSSDNGATYVVSSGEE